MVALGASGVAIRDRLKYLTGEDEEVLRAVGEHLGRLVQNLEAGVRTLMHRLSLPIGEKVSCTSCAAAGAS